MFGPTPWKSLELPKVQIHRNFTCPLYESCLSEMALLHKEGFTCVFCSMNKGNWDNRDKTQKESSIPIKEA